MSEIWRHSEETARVQDYQEAAGYLDDAMLISLLSGFLRNADACSCSPYLYCSHKRALDQRAEDLAGEPSGSPPERHEIRERDGVEVTGFGSAKRAYVSGRPIATGHIADPDITCGCDDCAQRRHELTAIEAEEAKYSHPGGCGCEPCVALWWRRTTALARRPDPPLLRPESGTCAGCGWELRDSARYCYYCTIRRERRAPGCEHGKGLQCPACYRPSRWTARQYRCACLALLGFGAAFDLAGLHAAIPLVLGAAILGLFALTGVRP